MEISVNLLYNRSPSSFTTSHTANLFRVQALCKADRYCFYRYLQPRRNNEKHLQGNATYLKKERRDGKCHVVNSVGMIIRSFTNVSNFNLNSDIFKSFPD